MRIYCDIDDVLSRTAESLLELAAREFGRVFSYEEVKSFDLQITFGFSDEEMKRFSYLSHLYENLITYEPVQGAVVGIKTLETKGHTIEFVTGRPATAHKATEDWLHRVGLGKFPVLYVDKYGREPPSGAGLPRTLSRDEFNERRYDIAIEDSPLALDVLRGWKETTVVVFDRPWNRSYPLASNMVRVKGWSEFCDIPEFLV